MRIALDILDNKTKVEIAFLPNVKNGKNCKLMETVNVLVEKLVYQMELVKNVLLIQNQMKMAQNVRLIHVPNSKS